MTTQTHIYLVPGFFGFTSLGALNYFQRVDAVLAEHLEGHGLKATIIDCHTQPTGSIRNRALALLKQVEETGGLEAERLHFIGHSTGGLDVRLLLTPDVRLVPRDVEERIGERTRSVITVATPHFGTPMANFFTTFQGRHLLQLLTLMATSEPGRHTIFMTSQVVQWLSRLDDALGRRNTALDSLSRQLLASISLSPEDPFWKFLQSVAADQGAIVQLTPEGTDLFNAAVTDRRGVLYASVVTAAPPPLALPLRELDSFERIAMAAIFIFLHSLSSREHRQYPYPSPSHALGEQLQRELPFKLSAATNDGVVPTLSQVYGEALAVVVADHLDVVGQFRDADGDPLSDWLPSGSHFDETRFRLVWRRIADAIARASQ